MQMRARMLVTIALVALRTGSLAGQEIAHRLRWLAGCWESQSGDQIIDEQWMAPRGGLMLGMARTVRAGKVSSCEQTLVRREADGRLVYVANVPGQAPTTFTAAAESDTAIAFRNMAHDFPKEVRYARLGADSLVASIAGDTTAGARRIWYRYGRVDCGR